MKLRTKLTYNLFFLFAVIVALAVVGSYYLSLLASVSTEVTTDNYRTLSYIQGMNRALANIDYALTGTTIPKGTPERVKRNFDSLETWLTLQEKNITEPGEDTLTAGLRAKIEQLRSTVALTPERSIASVDSTSTTSATFLADAHRFLYEIREKLDQIHQINSEVVVRENQRGTATAQDVILSMSIFGTIGILIGWLFAITLPGIIFKPINDFNTALTEITAGNYNLSLPATSKDEFGILAETFNRMTVKLKEYEQTNVASILSEKQRLTAMINRMSEGVIGIDTEQRVMFANDIALQLLDMKREELIGRYAPDIAMQNMLFAEITRRAKSGERGEEGMQAGYLKIVVGNRERLYAQTVLTLPVESMVDDPELTEQVIMLSDFTEFAEKDSAKTKLIATLSHELKTPASAIDMCVDLMSNPQVGNLNPEQNKYLETIKGNTLRIRKLITDMIDLAKVESGVIDLRMEPVRPELLIEKALEGVELFLQEKKIKTEINAERKEDILFGNHSAPTTAVMADINKAIWALNNLLVNAIRYSPSESTISIALQRERKSVTIVVTDQGSGFPSDAGERLFDRYARFDSEGTQGTGLGLAIVKEFMEAMGGSVGIENSPSQGSALSLTFRVAESTASEDRRL